MKCYSICRRWALILRVPNLLTVPGDPVAGLLLAKGELGLPVFLAIIISLTLYSAGILLNDIVDLKTDISTRPLPSGLIEPGNAKIVMLFMMSMAVLVASLLGVKSLIITLGLVCVILGYNLWGKKYSYFGSLLMGLCRGLSLFLGASVSSNNIFSISVIIAAIVLVLYIAIVTEMARDEDAERAKLIGLLLSALLFLQAVFVFSAQAGTESVVIGVGLLGLWPFNRLLARRFYAS